MALMLTYHPILKLIIIILTATGGTAYTYMRVRTSYQKVDGARDGFQRFCLVFSFKQLGACLLFSLLVI
ncbi:hypothetical protein D3Y57_16805 [Sphingomonas paeninsulae]|uniref:Uncharacterized protein n=1 Tax=Sphingomonas paeninsulae TaxID=2319844 RepID=A0A494TN54_SPHPE|nr:hypothetical protein D3Y57_16805 [Sphingomonas paeninsulae]